MSSVFYLGQQEQKGDIKIEAKPYPKKMKSRNRCAKGPAQFQQALPKLSVTYMLPVLYYT